MMLEQVLHNPTAPKEGKMKSKIAVLLALMALLLVPFFGASDVSASECPYKKHLTCKQLGYGNQASPSNSGNNEMGSSAFGLGAAFRCFNRYFPDKLVAVRMKTNLGMLPSCTKNGTEVNQNTGFVFSDYIGNSTGKKYRRVVSQETGENRVFMMNGNGNPVPYVFADKSCNVTYASSAANAVLAQNGGQPSVAQEGNTTANPAQALTRALGNILGDKDRSFGGSLKLPNLPF
jgi:hypothetical protein